MTSKIFLLAGIYGLLVVTPMYFMEGQISIDYPPPITHPEYFYGFIGVTVAWQLAFILISRDVVKYRLFMIPAMVEKGTYAVAMSWLYSADRVNAMTLATGLIDLVIGLLFLYAFIRTGRNESAPA